MVTFSEILGLMELNFRNLNIYIFESIGLLGRDYEKQKLKTTNISFKFAKKKKKSLVQCFHWIEFTDVPVIFPKFENEAFLLHRRLILQVS